MFRIVRTTGMRIGKGNYVEIQNSSVLDFENFTLCAKFKTNKFFSFQVMGDPHTFFSAVLSFDNSWSFGAVLSEDSYPAEPFERISENKAIAGGIYDSFMSPHSHFFVWNIKVWNRFCLQKNVTDLTLFINEKEVQKIPDFDQSRLSGNIRLMNFKINDTISYPMSGDVTDLQIWDGLNMPSENDSDGNVLAWKDVKLSNQEDLEIFDAEAKDIHNIKTYNHKDGKTISEARFFCLNQGKEIAVVTDKQMLKEMQTSLVKKEDPENDSDNIFREKLFFAGYSKYLKKWINIKTRQKLDENVFQIQGKFVLDIHHM